MMQWFWYRNDRLRERFVAICRDRDVQQLTFDAYMNKRLVRRRPMAHVRIFFKDVAHLLGMARYEPAGPPQGRIPEGAPKVQPRRRARALGTAALCAMVVAVLGMLSTDLGTWYAGLRRSAWQPADQWFGPAWTLIFALCALSAAEAWRAQPALKARQVAARRLERQRLPQRALEPAFPPAPSDWALAQVVLLWLSIVIPIVLSARASSRAAWLLVPYLAG